MAELLDKVVREELGVAEETEERNNCHFAAATGDKGQVETLALQDLWESTA